ncbi:hypothetical protein [Persicobacter diffluens]|uniref:Uncharacterized protein n=1 Tax=Persicobacter diffluens TaxID=981 RepID=A0AAN5AL04_9BACT|nr:hypothetical protein PEDI_32910 [Persicobacter diffluens]
MKENKIPKISLLSLLFVLLTFSTSIGAGNKVFKVKSFDSIDGKGQLIVNEVSGFGDNAKIGFYKVLGDQYQLIEIVPALNGHVFHGMEDGVFYAIIAFDSNLGEDPLKMGFDVKYEKRFIKY